MRFQHAVRAVRCGRYRTWPVARACAPSADSILDDSAGLTPLKGSSNKRILATSARMRNLASCSRCHSPSDSPDLSKQDIQVEGGHSGGHGARRGKGSANYFCGHSAMDHAPFAQQRAPAWRLLAVLSQLEAWSCTNNILLQSPPPGLPHHRAPPSRRTLAAWHG